MKYLTVQRVGCRTTEPIDDRLDRLMDELILLAESDSSLEDPDLAADLSTCIVDVQMIVDAEDQAQAMVKALAALRTAIHAMGVATPGWKMGDATMFVAPAGAPEQLLTSA